MRTNGPSRRAWRTVKVFLSSTFRDMHAERDHLIKVTFPALRERLLPHRVELYDIDLRWGITEDEAKDEKVIGLCLDQVDECRPFFLAFLGQRYGWVPRRVPDDAQQRFPIVQQFPGVSITELELRHGAMRYPNGSCTLVMLRSDQAIASVPEATRRRDFLEAEPELQRKLAALKAELEASPHQVQPYSATWNPKRYDRVNRTEGNLDDLDDFGRQVEAWLWQAVRTQLQLPDTPAEVDALDAEADLHERFLELRTRIYVGRDDLYRQLRDFALADGETPLLLTGESGLGKSAALARFVRDLRTEWPGVFVLPHFVGASPRTTSLAGMLARLTQELQRAFALSLPKAESADEIIRTFIVAVTSLPASARVVLVFDALNQLDADGRADTLVWLPEALPPNVRVFCSSSAGPQQAPRVLTAFGEREYVAVPLRPLSDDERRAIIRAVPKLVAKTLDEQQIDALLANPATRNPLFLMVTLEELRGYGSFDNLNRLIAKLPQDGDALTTLFERVFERLEKEFGRQLVERVLGLLACARRGLGGPELVELTRDLGPNAEELYPLLRQVEAYLHRRNGRYDFYHVSIRRAVDRHYLKWEDEEDQQDPWLRWHLARNPPASEPTEPERETRHRLINFFEANRLEPRALDELPWQLAQLRSWQRLFDLLGDLKFFDAAWHAAMFDVCLWWSLIKTVGGLEPIEAYQAYLLVADTGKCSELWSIAAFLHMSGHNKDSAAIWTSLIERFRSTGQDLYLARCLNNKSIILKDAGELDEGMRLLKEAEIICRRRIYLDSLGRCLHAQASILIEKMDYSGSMQLLKEEEVIVRTETTDELGLAACYSSQSFILFQEGELALALHLIQQAELINRQYNNQVGVLQTLGGKALIVEAMNDPHQSLQLLREKEAMCRRLNLLHELAETLGNQALLLRSTREFDQAIRLHKQEEAIFRRMNAYSGLNRCLRNQAGTLREAGNSSDALKILKELEGFHRCHDNALALAITLTDQAAILAFDQSSIAKSLILADKAYWIAAEHGDNQLCSEIELLIDEITGFSDE